MNVTCGKPIAYRKTSNLFNKLAYKKTSLSEMISIANAKAENRTEYTKSNKGEKSIQPNVALLKLPNKQNVVCASSDSDKDDDSYIGEDYSKSSYESGDSGRNKKASADSYGSLSSESDRSQWLCKPRIKKKGTYQSNTFNPNIPVNNRKRRRAIISSSSSTSSVEKDPLEKDKYERCILKTFKNERRKACLGESGNESIETYSSEESQFGQLDNGEDDKSIKDKRILHSNDLLFRCVSFFNEAKYKDLLLAPRMTDKIASFIIEERPFDDFKHLQRKLYECPRGGLILQAYVDGLENRSVIENILEDCKLQSKKIQSMLSNMVNEENSIKPDLSPGCTIHPHQEIGLKWLVLMHKLNLNAILADEMGLGKTIQIIAFLSYLKKESIKGPHLIIVPSSTVENWMYELKSWAPSIKILTYYGTLDERRHLRAMATDNTIDVLLTTYSMVGSKVEDRKFFKRFKINYVIYDEGHLLKNCSTERYKNLMKIHGERKILLTGTPLQNNLVELISLIYFTMTKLFRKYCNDVNQLLNQFQQKAPMMEAKNSMLYESEKIEQAKAILQPYILRRLKSDVLENLPIKHDRIIFCSMIDEQKRIYRDLMWEFKELSAKGKKVVTSKLMQLRQISNHPLLYRSRYTDDRVVKIAKVLCKKEETYYKKNPEHVAEDLSFLSDFAISQLCSKYKSTRKFCLNEDVALISGKFEVFDELLPKIKSQSDKVLIFSQFTAMMDIIEVYLKIRKYKCCRLDGATPVMERQELINKFNSSEDIFVFLLSTKAGGLGINLTTANHIIIHDIDFNPYNDKQAEDRCHRMGQKKEVYVVRLISSGTIEEEMLTIAQKKLQLEKEITGGNINDNGSERELVETLMKRILSS